MDTSKIIKGAVSSGRYTVTAPIVKEDYGLYLQIEGIELPSTYEVDFSNNENSGTSVTMIGNADGVLIPRQFIDSGKDVFAFLYHVGQDFGRTVYKFRIPNKLRPDRTEDTPTPEEQSVIDQAISALNEAVEQTAQDVESADQSAQSAQGYAEQAETARDTAQGYSNNAQTSANNASASAQASANSATASAQSASQSAQIKSDVQGMVSDAQGYAESASQSASASAQSASDAHGYAQSASASAQSASGYASNAQTSANTASAKAQDASTSAQTASTKATEASQSASQALSYKTDAESAKTASQTAQGLAESARDDAITAKTAAETAQGKAEDAQAAAESVAESIPSDYSQLSEDVSDLKEGLSAVAIRSKLNGWDSVDFESGYLNGNGTMVSNPQFRTTDYIPVSEGDVINYKLSGYSTSVYIVTGFDSAKARVASASVVGVTGFTTGTYTVPSGVAYVRLSSGSYANATFTSETVYGKTISTKNYVDGLVAPLVTRMGAVEGEIEQIEGVSADVESVKGFYEESPNMLDPTKCTDASSVGSGYVWSEYIPVTVGRRYTITADGVVYKYYVYNSSKTELSNMTIASKGWEFIAPENSAYVRLLYRTTLVTNVMFAEGVVGAFVPYGALIEKTEFPKWIERDTNNLLNPDVYVSDTNIKTDGTIQAYNRNALTDYIPVDVGSTYYFSGNKTGAGAFNDAYEWVANIASFPYTVPEGVAYIRIGYSKSVNAYLRKDNEGVTGMATYDLYDTFKMINAKPTDYDRTNGLYGLKWNALGDSITGGSGTTKSYRQFISERTGIINRNYGVSNTAIARRSASIDNDMWTRYTTMDDDADIITVFGGTNDHGNNIPIGQWGDSTETTLYGAMKILVEGLINKYMGKRIGFITPLPKYNLNNNTDYSYPSDSFKPYIDCIKDVCARYSIPVLDLYTESGISPSMANVRTAMIPDGLHPNAVGHELISWQIQRFLERI